MITVEDISKKYLGSNVLTQISLTLYRKEILALIGPSGCGKTTLLRIIAGFESPDEGRVVIDDRDSSGSGTRLPPFERNISMIFQDLALWPHMTVLQHLYFVMNNRKGYPDDLKTKINGILDEVKLPNCVDRYPHQLSGGEKQRLAIARALASKKNYLFMDEPFSNLDPVLTAELQEMTMGLKNNHGLGIIYVTHNIRDAIHIADRITVMNNGKIEQIGKTNDVMENKKTEFVKKFLEIK